VSFLESRSLLSRSQVCAATLTAILALSLALAINPVYSLIPCLIVLLLLFLTHMELVFPGLLILRSSLDAFSDIAISAGPLKFNTSAALSIFIAVSGLLYFAFTAKKNGLIHGKISSSFLGWVSVLIFWVLWALYLFGTDGVIAVREWTRLFSLLVIYLLSARLAEQKGYEYLVNVCLLSLFAPMAFGYYQILTSQGIIVAGVHRIYGTLAHPNAFSLYIVLFMAIAGWKLKFARRRLPWFVAQLVLLTALLHTFSLGGLVMITVLFVLLILKEFEFKVRLAVFFLLLLLLIGFGNTDTGQKRLAELKHMPSLSEVLKDRVTTNSFTWRILNWRLLLERWSERPVLGYGLNTAELVSPWQASPHNDYLRFLLELGVIGFLFFLWFLARIGASLKRRLAVRIDARQDYLAFLMGAVFVAWMVGSTVDNYITNTAFQFYFWALLAASMYGANCNARGNEKPISHGPQ